MSSFLFYKHSLDYIRSIFLRSAHFTEIPIW